MKFGIYFRSGSFVLSLILILLGVSLLDVSFLGVSSAQQPVETALIRGQFSGGNGTWKADDFGWFYYNLDKGVGGEELSIDTIGRLAEKGHIIYRSHVWPEEFEYKPWGSYNAVAFLGKPYLSGYPASSLTDEVSSLGKGELREILIDSNDVHILTYNSTMSLQNGYVLALREISESGDVANLVLFKNRKPVHMAAVSSGDTYVFKIQNMPIILVHLSKVMRGDGTGVVETDGVFEVSDAPVIRLLEGTKLGNMELTDLSENLIEFRNDRDLTLTQNSNVPLLDGLELVVLDEPNLIYYPQGGISEYGVQEIRGPAFTGNSTIPLHSSSGEVIGNFSARWNSANFSGFFFDPEDALGRETLTVEKLSDNTIGQAVPVIRNNTFYGISGGLQYNTIVEESPFKFKPWGYYYVIGFLGLPWFAGYEQETSSEIGNVSTIQQYRVIQIIYDSDQNIPLNTSRSLTLGEGYVFSLVSVNKDKAAVALWKDGLLVETAILRSNSTYIYKKNVGDVTDLPIIAVHVQNVFNDGMDDTIMINGLFQISEKNYLPIDFGRKFGDLIILPTPPGYISMANLDDSISLSRNKSTSIWPGMYIRSGDNDTLRYYPYTLQYVVPAPRMARDISYPRDVPSGGRANFSMVVQAGAIVQVTAEILDQSSKTICFRDLTDIGQDLSQGSGDLWGYFWTWNATVLKMSDDGSTILDVNGPIPGMLFINRSSSPLQVSVLFDNAGRIASIADRNTAYYLSPAGYALTNSSLSYSEALANKESRSKFIKIEPGSSILKLYDIVNGTTRMSGSNHTLTGPIGAIEPHAIRTRAPPGRYELQARVQNAVNAIRASGNYFNVTASDSTAGPTAEQVVFLGSAATEAGKNVTVPLKAPISGNKNIEIVYDPKVLKAIEITGPSIVSSLINQSAGKISIIMPSGCNSINITFKASDINTTTHLNITKVEGFRPDEVINGAITVKAEAKKSSAPTFAGTFAAALAALIVVALRRRKGG
ncbi:MAG: S-layer protein domain-containing protein [Methanotrichaceae archaeon]